MDRDLIQSIFGSSVELLRMHSRHAARLLRTRDVLNHQAGIAPDIAPQAKANELSARAVKLSREIERLEDQRENLMLTEGRTERTLSSLSGRLEAGVLAAIDPKRNLDAGALKELHVETGIKLKRVNAKLAEKRKQLDAAEKQMQQALVLPDRDTVVNALADVDRELSEVDVSIDSLLTDQVRALHPTTVASMTGSGEAVTTLVSLRRQLARRDTLATFVRPEHPRCVRVLEAEDIVAVVSRGGMVEASEIEGAVPMTGKAVAHGRVVSFDGTVPVRVPIELSAWDSEAVGELLGRKAAEAFSSGFAQVSDIGREVAELNRNIGELVTRLRDELGIPRAYRS